MHARRRPSPLDLTRKHAVPSKKPGIVAVRGSQLHIPPSAIAPTVACRTTALPVPVLKEKIIEGTLAGDIPPPLPPKPRRRSPCIVTTSTFSGTPKSQEYGSDGQASLSINHTSRPTLKSPCAMTPKPAKIATPSKSLRLTIPQTPNLFSALNAKGTPISSTVNPKSGIQVPAITISPPKRLYSTPVYFSSPTLAPPKRKQGRFPVNPSVAPLEYIVANHGSHARNISTTASYAVPASPNVFCGYQVYRGRVLSQALEQAYGVVKKWIGGLWEGVRIRAAQHEKSSDVDGIGRSCGGADVDVEACEMRVSEVAKREEY